MWYMKKYIKYKIIKNYNIYNKKIYIQGGKYVQKMT